MHKPHTPPVTLKALETELRLALLVQASHIASIANLDAAAAFLNHEVDWDTWEGEDVNFDLTHFHIWTIVKAAYEYAYHFDPTDYVRHGFDLGNVLEGMCKWDADGTFSPLWYPDSCLRQLQEKTYARDRFDKDGVLDIKELSRLIDCPEETTEQLFAHGGAPKRSSYKASEVSDIIRMHPNFVASRKTRSDLDAV